MANANVKFKTGYVDAGAYQLLSHIIHEGGLVVDTADSDAVRVTGAQTIAGVKTFSTSIAVDTIAEKTAATGVTVDGVLLKDSGVTVATIAEASSGAGITATGKIISDKGTVTQATSKTTTVVLNKPAGVITTVALTDALDTSFEFTLTNSAIAATSVIQLTALNSGTGVAYPTITSISTGSAVIRVSNVGVASFNSLVKIHFTVS